jgi:hypothetical protein
MGLSCRGEGEASSVCENNTPLRIVVHVPKCGGRTIQNHLARHLGPRFWSVNKRYRNLPLGLFGRKYDRARTHSPAGILAVSGHALGRSVERLFPGRPLVRTLVLRDPESQVLSWYNFRMMRYISAGLSPYSFRLFLRSMPVDPVTHFLLEYWHELPWLRIASLGPIEKRQLLDSTLDQFDAIVDISKTDQLIAWHSRALGIPQRAARANDSENLARQTGWQPIRLADLSEAERADLAEHVHFDRYLWRRWALKQDITFDPMTSQPFLRKELARFAPQIQRRMARRFAVGTGLLRPEPTAACPPQNPPLRSRTT